MVCMTLLFFLLDEFGCFCAHLCTALTKALHLHHLHPCFPPSLLALPVCFCPFSHVGPRSSMRCPLPFLLPYLLCVPFYICIYISLTDRPSRKRKYFLGSFVLSFLFFSLFRRGRGEGGRRTEGRKGREGRGGKGGEGSVGKGREEERQGREVAQFSSISPALIIYIYKNTNLIQEKIRRGVRICLYLCLCL